MPSYEILFFNEENLRIALTYKVFKGIDKHDVWEPLFPNNPAGQTQHFNYLLSYLSTDNGDSLNCQTILIEYDYFSESYFNDFTHYYIGAYYPFPKTCQRVHFFCRQFDKQTFELALLQHNNELWDSYLGYIVIKPLPEGSIGATILKHYTDKKSNDTSHLRNYFAVKDYQANLFGKPLTVETMIYQEQDGVVGACATAALWFALHQLNRLFSVPILSPAQITLAAGHTADFKYPVIPSKGLGIEQILKAIYGFDLSVDFVDFTSKEGLLYVEPAAVHALNTLTLKLFINAYSYLKVPLLLGIELQGGKHLMTVAGCRYEDDRGPVTYLGERIDRVFAHDDQVGPFSKLIFDPYIEDNPLLSMQTAWKEKKEDGNEVNISASINTIIAPLSKSIKVEFIDVFKELLRYRLLIDSWQRHKPAIEENKISYDVFIISSNEYKQLLVDEWKNFTTVDISLLQNSVPKYLWVIRGYGLVSKGLYFDICYDPYNANFKYSPIAATIYNQKFKVALTSAYSFTNNLQALGQLFNLPLVTEIMQPEQPLTDSQPTTNSYIRDMERAESSNTPDAYNM